MRITSERPFDTDEWFYNRCVDGHELTPQALRSVCRFTLLWNLFEDTVCRNRAAIEVFEEISKDMARREPIAQDIEAPLKFWIDRYWTGKQFTDRFAGLNFRRNDRREHVETVLRGERGDTGSKLLAMLIIVYRLRNNLFHGLKRIDMLNDQRENLDMACSALEAVLERSHANFIRH